MNVKVEGCFDVMMLWCYTIVRYSSVGAPNLIGQDFIFNKAQDKSMMIPHKGLIMQSLDGFLNMLLNKQSNRWSFETP